MKELLVFANLCGGPSALQPFFPLRLKNTRISNCAIRVKSIDILHDAFKCLKTS